MILDSRALNIPQLCILVAGSEVFWALIYHSSRMLPALYAAISDARVQSMHILRVRTDGVGIVTNIRMRTPSTIVSCSDLQFKDVDEYGSLM